MPPPIEAEPAASVDEADGGGQDGAGEGGENNDNDESNVDADKKERKTVYIVQEIGAKLYEQQIRCVAPASKFKNMATFFVDQCDQIWRNIA